MNPAFAAILSIALGGAAIIQPGNPSSQLALVGGTIYANPTEEPVRGGVVLIRDGRIAAVDREASVQIPRNTRVIDCSGLTITAGFWNSHVHFFERKWANATAIPAPELSRRTDPSKDIRALATVRYTLRDGNIIYRAPR